jgi:hypothetical protein
LWQRAPGYSWGGQRPSLADYVIGTGPRTVRPLAQDVHVAYALKLLKKSTLKIYEKFPHGMCTTHADVINADLLAFIKR